MSKLADEYNAMDAEDIVGGVRTRFRYREVSAYNCHPLILAQQPAPLGMLEVRHIDRAAPVMNSVTWVMGIWPRLLQANYLLPICLGHTCFHGRESMTVMG